MQIMNLFLIYFLFISDKDANKMPYEKM